MLRNGELRLISSPSYTTLEPFSWGRFSDVPHFGMQDEWKFPWVRYNEPAFKLTILNYENEI
jgi:hypothetical protein